MKTMKNSQFNSYTYFIIPIFLFRSICTSFHVTSPFAAERSRKNLSKRLTSPCTRSLASYAYDDDSRSSDISIWLSHKELERLSHELNQSHEKVASLHADVTYHNNDNDNDNTPSQYRLNKYSKLLQTHPHISMTPIRVPPHDAQEATEKTIRWCSEFVQELHLCPWAAKTLQSQNGIRIKIIHQTNGLEGMERVIRESAHELIQLTDEESGDVDINVGITFVVALPTEHPGHNREFQFQGFYDFCTDLEDRLFDEADEEHETREAGLTDMTDDFLIGDEITIAPFHPNWSFSTGGYEIDTAEENPLDYEKKSPYPTISLVRTSVIQGAGEEATGRIAIHNEKILQDFGAKRLKKLYDENVLRIGRTK